MGNPNVHVLVTADGSQAASEVAKAGAALTKLGTGSGKATTELFKFGNSSVTANAELLKFGVGAVTVGSLLADLGRGALEVGKDLARFPLDAAVAVGRYAEQLDNLTAQTGLSATEQQAYNVILNRAGLGLQDLSGIWRILSQNVIAARDPLSDAALKFRQLGIELNGSEGPNEVLQLVSERLQALPDGFKKNTLATELLGRSGAQFLPAFKEGLGGAANEAKRLGTMLNDEARVKAAAFDDATDDLNLAWQGFTHQIGVLAAPALTTAVEGMTAGTAQASKFAAEMNSATTAAEGLATVLAHASPFTARGVAPVAPAAGGTKTLPVGAIPTDDAFTESLAASGRGFIAPGDDQAAKARKIIQRSQQMQFDRAHMAELQPGLASTFDINAVMAREQSDAASRARPDLSGLNELQKGIAAIRDLMPELDANEALQLVTHNLEAGHAAVLASVDGWQSYRDGLGDAADSARILESQQTELYQTESGLLGAADAARRVSFSRIDAEEAQKRQLILDTFGASERGQQKLLDLETQTATQRMAVIRQFPTFWEQQLQGIVNSNSFSLGSIVSTWSSGLATAAVQHKNFNETIKASSQSTQIAILQFGINSLVQWGAQLALSVSREIGLTAALEAAKNAIFGTGTAARTGVAVAGDATIVASSAAAAGATVGIWGGAALAISGFFATTLAAFGALVTGLVAIVTAVGTFVMGVLTAIGTALGFTGFGAPLAGGILVGVALIAAALAATGNLGFKEGGIGDFGAGTQATLHGQEAIIPLDGRGKRFMNQLGFGGGGEQRIIVQVGDDVLTEKVLRGMPRMVRMRVGGALA